MQGSVADIQITRAGAPTSITGSKGDTQYSAIGTAPNITSYAVTGIGKNGSGLGGTSPGTTLVLEPVVVCNL